MKQHECGVGAVALKSGLKEVPLGGAAHYLYQLILAEQNRGRGGAGIATQDSSRQQEVIRVQKKNVLVRNLFMNSQDDPRRQKREYEAVMEELEGSIGIAHVRYPTSGSEGFLDERLQPVYQRGLRLEEKFALAVNMNLTNDEVLRRWIRRQHAGVLDTDVDTAIIRTLIAMKKRELAAENDGEARLKDVLSWLAPMLDGDYCGVYLNGKGELHAFRDPLGMRPLCYAEDERLLAVASESAALQKIGFSMERITDVPAGHVLSFVDGTKTMEQFAHVQTIDHCVQERAGCTFEHVYFGRPGTYIDGVASHELREALGRQLALHEPLRERIAQEGREKFVVVPVPRTSRTAAIVMAEMLGLHYREGIERDEESGRTFIDDKAKREEAADNKYSYVRAILEGKMVIIVDDSIVRGTTIERVARGVMNIGGAAETHWRITCPPLTDPCAYAIDVGTYNELIAARFPNDQRGLEEYLTKHSAIGSIRYLPLGEFKETMRGVGLQPELSCMGCWTGRYPTRGAQAQVDRKRTKFLTAFREQEV